MAKSVASSFDNPVEVEAVYQVLSGPDWAATKADRLGDDSTTLRRDVHDGDAVTLVMSRRLPPGVPGFLQKFLPADPRVTTTDTWGPAHEGGRSGTWTADLGGVPVALGGTMRIEPIAGGSRYTIEGEVRVSVPLIGGKAESYIAEQITKLARAEEQVVRDVLLLD